MVDEFKVSKASLNLFPKSNDTSFCSKLERGL